MLIDSPRLSDGDRAHWDRLEHYDDVLSRDRRLDRLVDQGIAACRDWSDGQGTISVSWGKDSVVAAHIAMLAGITDPIVWVRSDPYEMPECEQVRDEFLALWPSARYEERPVVLRNPKRGEPGFEEHLTNPDSRSQDVLKEAITGRYLSGVRGQEAKVRAISVNSRGLVTKNTCRPIGRWSAEQVFAYSHREGLPVHTAYAASFAGTMDRRWIRVHPLCSTPPGTSTVHDWNWAGWEDHYWGDHIRWARELRSA